MASVCAGSLAMLDAGVPLKRQCAGIAMGLISEGASESPTGKPRFAVLTDLLGDEDALGDMDFKIAGTEKGITACQMDIKVEGLSREILQTAIDQAERGRGEILRIMDGTCAAPRAAMKPHVPRIVRVNIPREFVGQIIGPGGKNIQGLQRETGTTIDIEDRGEGEDAVVEISGGEEEGTRRAVAAIRGATVVPEVGTVYEGPVKTITAFGAFVEFLPGKDGLLHISEVAWERLPDLEGVLAEGDVIQVKVPAAGRGRGRGRPWALLIGVDERTGKFKLSRKVLLEKPAAPEPAAPRSTGAADDAAALDMSIFGEEIVPLGGGDRGDRGDRERRGGGVAAAAAAAAAGGAPRGTRQW
eukprot:tig00021073_g18050.t1